MQRVQQELHKQQKQTANLQEKSSDPTHELWKNPSYSSVFIIDFIRILLFFHLSLKNEDRNLKIDHSHMIYYVPSHDLNQIAENWCGNSEKIWNWMKLNLVYF